MYRFKVVEALKQNKVKALHKTDKNGKATRGATKRNEFYKQFDSLVRRHGRALWRISYLTGMAPYPQLLLMHGFMQLVE